MSIRGQRARVAFATSALFPARASLSRRSIRRRVSALEIGGRHEL